MKETGLDIQEVDFIIDHALREDVGSGDITTDSLIPEEAVARASMKAKASGIVAGLPIAERVFKKLDPHMKWLPRVKDGDKVNPGDILVEMEGAFRALLTGERLALNLLQRMSGIATETARYMAELEGFKTKILDTRKTVPGLRILDKYAVKMGGGTNHRIGLFDLAMIKDNHIKVAGGISKAVAQVRVNIPSNIKIEVETTNLREVQEAIDAGADIIMLDNMSNEMTLEAVELIKGRALVEASGNMSVERLKDVAATGVDMISVGALTHSIKALDISQNIEI